jgi:hypothetical protein
MDVMTPITERTLEFTAHSRPSMGVTGVPMLVEEDGEDTEDEESEADIAFGRAFTESATDSLARAHSSTSTRSSPAPADVSGSSSRTVVRTRLSLNGQADGSLELTQGLTIAAGLEVTDTASLVLVNKVDGLTLHDAPPATDPLDANVLASIMASYPTPTDLIDLRLSTARKLAILKKQASRKPRRSSAGRAAGMDEDEASLIELGDDLYSVREKLGCVARSASSSALTRL